MSKIAIISHPGQRVLIDISGCLSMQEATEHLSSTLQVSSQFWQGLTIDLNFGNLNLNEEQVLQLLNIAKQVGVVPREIFSQDENTKVVLSKLDFKIGHGQPASLPLASDKLTDSASETYEEDNSEQIDTTGIRIVMHDGLSSSDETDLDAQVNSPKTDSVLYLKHTLRSGQAVSHKGHLVIIGDVNAGAEIMAEGDITVWGCLRGVAHAGVGGNLQAEIRALKLQPIQIRIAHAIARSPDPPHVSQGAHWGPESARLVEGKIRILRNTLD